MALVGKKRKFAQAVVAAKPLKISNREAALQAGYSKSTASAAGSRCAADDDVQAYIKAHWAGYGDTHVGERDKAREPKPPKITEALLRRWIEEQEAGSEALNQLIQAICTKLGATDNPLEYWRGIMLDPWAESKDKMVAAENIAKYTLPKPVAKSKKEEEADTARALLAKRNPSAVVERENVPSYAGKIPIWTQNKPN